MKPFHIFLMVCAAAAWGLNFITTRIVLEVFSSEQIAFTRAIVTLIVLLPWWKPFTPVSWKFLGAVFAIGAVAFYLLYEAIRLTDSLTSVSIGTQLMAPMAAIVALILYREPISGRKWLGIVIATSGAMLLIASSGSQVSVIALVITALAVLTYAIGSIIGSRTASVDVWRMLAWISAVSIVPMGLLAGFKGPLFPDPGSFEIRHWLGLLFSIMVASVMGQAILFSMYKKYQVADVAPYMLFVPVFTAVFAMAYYNEVLDPFLVLGGATVLLGVWIQQSRSKRPEKP